MKKVVFLMLILVLALSLTVSAKTLKVMVRPDEGNVVHLYADEFEKKTGIEVDVTYVGWDKISTKTTAALMDDGGGYDVVFVASADKAKFNAMGQFADLNQYFTEDEKDDFLQSILDYYTCDGKMIGVPWYSGAAHFAYNSQYLKNAGVEVESIKTWEDLLNVSKAITEESAAEYVYTPSAKYPGNYYYNYGSIVEAMGGKFFDEDYNPIFNKGIGLKALQILVDGVEEGVFNPAGTSLDDYETLKVFQSGKSAFLLNSTWSTNQTMVPEASSVADDANIMMIPGGENNDTGGLIYAGGFAVTKSSPNKEEAVEFIKLLTSSEAQILHAINGTNLPTRLSLFDGSRKKAITKAWPAYSKLVAQVEAGTFGPDVLWLDPFRRKLATAVQDALSGEKTPEEALDWVAEEVIEIKSQYE